MLLLLPLSLNLLTPIPTTVTRPLTFNSHLTPSPRTRALLNSSLTHYGQSGAVFDTFLVLFPGPFD